MKVLILTNPEFANFCVKKVLKHSLLDDDWVVFDYKYDWVDDYDVGISFMYQYRVPKEQLDGHVWFNFHPGPLPEYKGRNLCYHALANGEKQFGATVHYMDEGFDTGYIVEVLRFFIPEGWCADDLSSATLRASEELFIKYLPVILSGEFVFKFENTGGHYYHKEPINEFLTISKTLENEIRAITYKDHYPKIDIGGTIFKVVRE